MDEELETTQAFQSSQPFLAENFTPLRKKIDSKVVPVDYFTKPNFVHANVHKLIYFYNKIGAKGYQSLFAFFSSASINS